MYFWGDPDKEDSGRVGEWVGSNGRGWRRGNRLEHVNFPTWKLLLQMRRISPKAENGLGVGEGEEGEEVSGYQRFQFPPSGRGCTSKMPVVSRALTESFPFTLAQDQPNTDIWKRTGQACLLLAQPTPSGFSPFCNSRKDAKCVSLNAKEKRCAQCLSYVKIIHSATESEVKISKELVAGWGRMTVLLGPPPYYGEMARLSVTHYCNSTVATSRHDCWGRALGWSSPQHEKIFCSSLPSEAFPGHHCPAMLSCWM